MQPPDVLHVKVDNREKNLVRIPDTLDWRDNRGYHKVFAIHTTIDEALPYGDFVLEGFESIVAFERKGSLQECANNLFTADRARQMRAFKCLITHVKHPWLLLDLPAARAWRIVHGEVSHGQVIDALNRLCLRTGMRSLMFLGGITPHEREILGEVIVRTLWDTVWEECMGCAKIPAALGDAPCQMT